MKLCQSDPMDIFNLVGSSSFGIQDLPIDNMIMFFNQLGRMQTFCKKYNLTVKDIQNNEELEERFKQYLIMTLVQRIIALKIFLKKKMRFQIQMIDD